MISMFVDSITDSRFAKKNSGYRLMISWNS